MVNKFGSIFNISDEQWARVGGKPQKVDAPKSVEEFVKWHPKRRSAWFARKRAHIDSIHADVRKLVAEQDSIRRQITRYSKAEQEEEAKPRSACLAPHPQSSTMLCLRPVGHRGHHVSRTIAWPNPLPAPARPACAAMGAFGQCELNKGHVEQHTRKLENGTVIMWRTSAELRSKPVFETSTCTSLSSEGWRCMLMAGHTGTHRSGDLSWNTITVSTARCKAIFDPFKAIRPDNTLAVCDLESGHTESHHTEGFGWWSRNGVIGYAI